MTFSPGRTSDAAIAHGSAEPSVQRLALTFERFVEQGLDPLDTREIAHFGLPPAEL